MESEHLLQLPVAAGSDGGAKTAATGVDARKGRECRIRWLGLSTPSDENFQTIERS